MKTAAKSVKRFQPGPEMNVEGLRVLVVGAARTGVETANFLDRRSALVTVTDMKGEEDVKDALAGLNPGVARELGGHRRDSFLSRDLIIPSPGVPMDHILLAAARQAGIPVMSEIELAYRFLPVPLIAVTGTNGKSTVVTALAEVFREAGIAAGLGGNIGNPLIGEIERLEKERFVVAEISSFQLEWVENFRPWIAAVLNISEDHLDRYRSMNDYVAAKTRLYSGQKSEDYLVLNADDPLVRPLGDGASARVIWFSRRSTPLNGVYLFRGWIYSRLNRGAGRRVMPVSEMRIAGEHNWENAMAVAAISLLAGASAGNVREAFKKFRGLPHRTEFVREREGVKFYDDSKGTNVGATARTLAGFQDPVILIAGGRDKGGDYSPLAPLVGKHVRCLIVMGEARERIAAELEGATSIVKVDGMEEAVRIASSTARTGDTVLLSPACSSFDQYRDYAERGRHFQEEVRKL